MRHDYEHDSRIDAQQGECPDCGGPLTYDEKHAEAFCTDCGVVVTGCQFAREAGDGATESGECLKDTNRPKNRHAARGPQATTFHADDATGGTIGGRPARRLWRIQHDYNRDGDGLRSERFKRDRTEAIAGALPVSDAVKQEAVELAATVDGRAFNRIGGVEAVALGCIAVAQNSRIDRPEDYENRIQVRGGEDVSPFKQLSDDYGVEWRKAIKKVKE